MIQSHDHTRFRIQLLSVFNVLLLISILGSITWAAPVPGQGQKVPLVLIALDSSGSMEYLEVDGIIPTCTHPFYLKNRWSIAQEVLTGTFPEYTCEIDSRITPLDREDYAYPVPHIVYNFVGAQPPDGLLDTNGDAIKFAYMSFDTNFGVATDASGGWSYGDNVDVPALSKNLGLSTINLGARNENALHTTDLVNAYTGGGLVKFLKGTEDSPASLLKARATDVQNAILNTIPFGGTPLSPMLKDIEFYFTFDPELQPYKKSSDVGDPAWECRSRNVILITDGKPSMGEGDGYPLSVESASDLYFSHPLGVKIFVVGYNLEDSSDLTLLDEIAAIGDPDNPDAHAYLANNAQELVFALSQVIGSILEGIQSRTLTVHTNTTNNVLDAQYQFNTAYGDIPVNTLDRQGYIEQHIYRCTNACKAEGIFGAQFCETFSISDQVNTDGTSAPVYLVKYNQFELFSKANNAITPDTLDIPNGGTTANPTDAVVQLLSLEPQWNIDGTKQILGSESLGYSNDEATREAYKDQLIDLIHASPESRRKGFRVGGIFHGTPAILDAPPGGVGFIPSYGLFLDSIAGRATTLFQPTHMGELMAFQIDRPTGLSKTHYGRHLWSVIPQHLAPRLKENADKTVFLMDLAPTVSDILLQKQGVNTDPEDEAKKWRSVLVQGYRNARGYFALDVTDPKDPEFMWEIDPDQRCYNIDGGGGCEKNTYSGSDFCYLGNTISKPVITTLFLTNYEGQGQHERAVAIFGGGTYDDGSSTNTLECGNHSNLEPSDIGRTVYVVDLETGDKIQEFRPSLGNVAGKGGNTTPASAAAAMQYELVGSAACFNTSIGAITTRCFIGDDGGQIWRLDLSSGNPDDWRLSFFHDAYEELPGTVRSPIFEAPTLALQGDTGLLAVLYGTGNIDYTESAGTHHAVYSLLEQITLNSDGGLADTSDVIAKVNWRRLFSDGTSVMGTPVVFDEVAYFTTYHLDPENTCTAPQDAAKLWGLHYVDSTSSDPSIVGEPVAALDLDGDPLTPDDLAEFIVLPEGIPYGVHIIQRPSCSGEFPLTSTSDSGQDGSAYGAIEQGDAELVVQYEASNEQSQTEGSNAAGNKAATHVQKLKRPTTTLTPISWGLIFY